jgi:4-hydroxybenzoate polyprenyltransferase
VALSTARVLTVVGLALAVFTGRLPLVLIAVVTVIIGWGYSAGPVPLKRSAVGTFVVSTAGGGLTYAAGAFATGDPVSTGYLVVFVLLSAWMGVAGASKDLGDALGDRLGGRNTLPVMLGERRARLAIATGSQLIGAAAALTAAHWPATAAPAAVLVVGALCVGVLCLRGSEQPGRDAQRRPYRAFMVTQYVANLALLIHSLP